MDSEEILDSSADLFDDADTTDGHLGGITNNSSSHDDSLIIVKQFQDKQAQEQVICNAVENNEDEIGEPLVSTNPSHSGLLRLGHDISHENEKESEAEHGEEGLSSKRQRVCKSEYSEIRNDSEEDMRITDDPLDNTIVLDDSGDDEHISANKDTDEGDRDKNVKLDEGTCHKFSSEASGAHSFPSPKAPESSVDVSPRNSDHPTGFAEHNKLDLCGDLKSQQKEQSRVDLELTCPFCSKQEVSLYRLEFHVETMHPEFSSAEAGLVGSNTDATSKKFSENLSDFGVLVDDDPFRFICPLCDLDLGDEETLNLHLNTMHEEEEKEEAGGIHTCPLCGISCSSEQDMKQHIKTHTNDSTYHGISTDDSKSVDEAASASAASLTLREMNCPVCGLAMADADLLTSHVESHFNPQHSARPNLTSAAPKRDCSKETTSQKSSSEKQHERTQNAAASHTSQENFPSSSKGKWAPSESRENGSYRRQYEENLEKAVMKGQLTVTDYHEMKSKMAQRDLKGVDDGSTRTQGLVEKIKALFQGQARPGQVVHLCSSTDHFAGSYGDKGWGCGYRNLQMMLSTLSRHPDYAGRIFTDGNVSIPSVPKIQQLIEAAWKNGFDPQGRSQLRGQLVNTRKWIGATEIVATLSSLGVKCHLADFHAPTASDGTHPRLLEWVLDYFSRSQQEFIPPLYLQHQGHSRTIIGVENDRGTVKLLLFDPGSNCDYMASLAKGQLSWKQMRTFRRTQAGFRAKQYQIVAVTGLLTDAEYQESKILHSERVS